MIVSQQGNSDDALFYFECPLIRNIIRKSSLCNNHIMYPAMVKASLYPCASDQSFNGCCISCQRHTVFLMVVLQQTLLMHMVIHGIARFPYTMTHFLRVWLTKMCQILNNSWLFHKNLLTSSIKCIYLEKGSKMVTLKTYRLHTF